MPTMVLIPCMQVVRWIKSWKQAIGTHQGQRLRNLRIRIWPVLFGCRAHKLDAVSVNPRLFGKYSRKHFDNVRPKTIQVTQLFLNILKSQDRKPPCGHASIVFRLSVDLNYLIVSKENKIQFFLLLCCYLTTNMVVLISYIDLIEIFQCID